MDRPVPDLTRVFASGQSVVVKVIEVKEDKDRFLCSLRLCDCYHDDPSASVETLETYMNERDRYLDAMLDHNGVFFIQIWKFLLLRFRKISDLYNILDKNILTVTGSTKVPFFRFGSFCF